METILDKLKRELKEVHGEKMARMSRIDPIATLELETQSGRKFVGIQIKRPVSAYEALASWSKSVCLTPGSFSDLSDNYRLDSGDVAEITDSLPCKTTSWVDDEGVYFMTGNLIVTEDSNPVRLIRRMSDSLTINSLFHPSDNLRLGTGTVIVMKA